MVMIMNNILALCNLHTAPEIEQFKNARSFPVIPFLGRYVFLDFILSNFSNSDIDKMGILVRHNPQNINMHLGGNQVWNKNTKTGFLYMLYDERGILNEKYNTDISNLKLNSWVLKRAKIDYVIVASCHYLIRFDYRNIIAFHKERGNDVTMLYKESELGKELPHVDILNADDNGRVKNIYHNDLRKKKVKVDIESYVFSFPFLMNILKHEGQGISFKDAIRLALKQKDVKVECYPFDGSVQAIFDFKDYYHTSLALLSYKQRRKLFSSNWTIYTRTHDTPPSRLGEMSEVKNSFISNGSYIDGHVDSSILARNVTIEKDAKVEKSLIFSEAIIESGAIVRNAVVEHGVRIKANSVLEGSFEHPLYIDKSN